MSNQSDAGETDPVRSESPADSEGGSDRDQPPGGTERRKTADRRQSVVDRRSGLDRRRKRKRPPDIPDLYERRGPGIRRSEDRRAAEEGEMTEEQWEFVQAVNEYKRVNNKAFPTWTEVLEVIKKLGYRKTP